MAELGPFGGERWFSFLNQWFLDFRPEVLKEKYDKIDAGLDNVSHLFVPLL